MRKPTQEEISEFITYRANHVALVQKLGQVALDMNFSDHDSDKIGAIGKELDLFTLRHVSKTKNLRLTDRDKDILRKISGKHAKSQKHHAEYWDETITLKNFDANDGGIIHGSKMPKRYIAEMACDWAACALYHNEPIFAWYNKVVDETLIFTDTQKKYLKACLILVRKAITKYNIQFPGVSYTCTQVEPKKEKMKEYKIGDRVRRLLFCEIPEVGTIVDFGWKPAEFGDIRSLKIKWDEKPDEVEEVYDFLLEPLKEDGPCNSSGSFSAMAPERMHLIKTVVPVDDPFTSNEVVETEKKTS